MKEEIKKEVEGYKRLLHEIQELLHQKIFWKIQGLNLFLIVKKIVYFTVIALSLIFVVSVVSQALRLSVYQKTNILSAVLVLLFLVELFRALKNMFHGSEANLEFIKTMMSGFLWAFVIYLSFSIQLTNFEKISELITRWFMVACLFKLFEFLVFRKLSNDTKSGKKSDWIRSIERQVTNKYEDGSLIFNEVSENYKLKYTKIKFTFKKTHDYLGFVEAGVRRLGGINEQNKNL